MIRDPSDGSVREKSAPAFLGSLPSGESDPAVTPDCAGAGTVSGLAPDHSNRAKRLQESREWLQNYHQEKSHARRGNHEKHSQDRSSGHDQG